MRQHRAQDLSHAAGLMQFSPGVVSPSIFSPSPSPRPDSLSPLPAIWASGISDPLSLPVYTPLTLRPSVLLPRREHAPATEASPATTPPCSSPASSLSESSETCTTSSAPLEPAEFGLGLAVPLAAPQPSRSLSMSSPHDYPSMSGSTPATHTSGLDLEHDRIWASGQVYVAPGARFPKDIYARDMAKALSWLSSFRGNDIPPRFSTIFPSIPFVWGTYYAQLSLWKECTQEQREWLANQPRTPAGLWTESRRHLPAWQARPRHR
ncbi:hypothetical protein NUW54_g11277 [Trametes sanguinea]|uniref:Uncharacterized protein n=1 Tax=Trametes sanguinea TaxID=158606 RepID=A0ACC1NJA7_9APHY|nr:hypothetical protein NUW54_g11277 [Trametes sanguinea]